MLTRALMDSHYGKPNVIARAFREPCTAAGQPVAHTTEMPDNGRVRRPNPLMFEKSRLGGPTACPPGAIRARTNAQKNPGRLDIS